MGHIRIEPGKIGVGVKQIKEIPFAQDMGKRWFPSRITEFSRRGGCQGFKAISGGGQFFRRIREGQFLVLAKSEPKNPAPAFAVHFTIPIAPSKSLDE